MRSYVIDLPTGTVAQQCSPHTGLQASILQANLTLCFPWYPNYWIHSIKCCVCAMLACTTVRATRSGRMVPTHSTTVVHSAPSSLWTMLSYLVSMMLKVVTVWSITQFNVPRFVRRWHISQQKQHRATWKNTGCANCLEKDVLSCSLFPTFAKPKRWNIGGKNNLMCLRPPNFLLCFVES